jgi:hypothetical protein
MNSEVNIILHSLQGDWATYQSAESVDELKLRTLTEFKFITVEGRWLSSWALKVASVRANVKIAVVAAQPGMMAKALAEINRYKPDAHAPFADRDFFSNCPEFVAVRIHCENDSRILADLRASHNILSLASRQSRLVDSIERANQAHLNDHELVDAGSHLLARTVAGLAAIPQALTSLNCDELRAAIETQCSDVSTDLEVCMKHLQVAELLNPALLADDESRLLEAVQLASKLGISDHPIILEFSVRTSVYQQRVRATLKALSGASTAQVLQSCLNDAHELKLDAHENVRKAQDRLDRILRLSLLIDRALKTPERQLLAHALTEAKLCGLDDPDVSRCQRLHSVLDRLEAVMAESSSPTMDVLTSILGTVGELGTPDTPLILKARQLHSKMQSIVSQAAVLCELAQQQVTSETLARLRQVVQSISQPELAGLASHPGLVAAQTFISSSESEIKLLLRVKDALLSGGWVVAAKGSIALYQETQRLEWEALLQAVEDVRELKMRNEQAAWLVKWASIVVKVRQGILAVGADPFASFESWQEVRSNLFC